jgi:fibronectin type 3 domain-containing protein
MLVGAYYNHPIARTGAPGDDGTCRDCHDNYKLNPDDGYVSLTGLPESYAPGTSYILTVSVYSYDRERFAFEFTIVSDTQEQATGSFTIINSTTTMLDGGNKYIKTTRYGYDNPTNYMKTWQFQWNSPSKAEAPVTFYGVGMGSDCDNDEDGDRVYTLMQKVQPAPKVPVKPQGIIVEPSEGYVTLSWYMPIDPNTSEGFASYNVYWSDSATGGLDLLETVTTRQYVHNGLANGHTYRYQISSTNSEGEGPLSDVVTAVPNNVPDKPRHLETGTVSNDQITITWDAPSTWGDGGSKSFNVYRGMTPWEVQMIASDIAVSSYTDTSALEANMTYHYRVQAATDRGTGGVATLSVFVPPAPPGFPPGLSVIVARGAVELSWQEPTDTGGDPVDYYRVYRTVPGQDPVLVKDCLYGTTCIDDTVDPDQTYEYTVAAVNSAGEGALSTPVEAFIVPPPSVGDSEQTLTSEVPFSGLVVVCAVIIIGVVMVGRLSRATSIAEGREED